MNFINIPEEFIPYVDKIKNYKQWKETGLTIKKDRSSNNLANFHPIIKNGLYYRFEFISEQSYSPMDNDQQVCFLNNKRYTKRPIEIYYLVKQGVEPNEFYYFDESMFDYFHAVEYYEKKEYLKALESIEKSIALKASDEYCELRSCCKVELHDIVTAKMLFEKHKNDIDSAIHSGEVFKWLKCFIFNEDYVNALYYIKFTSINLDRLINEKVKDRIYCVQSKESYEYYRETFLKRLHLIFVKFKWKSATKTEQLKDLAKYIDNFYTGENISFKNKIQDFI